MNIPTILPQTRKAYSLIHQMTGDLGGSSHGGAIYGEITIVSMQKIVAQIWDLAVGSSTLVVVWVNQIYTLL